MSASVQCASRRSSSVFKSEAVNGTPDWRVAQPLRIRRPNVHDGVMHVLAARRTNLRHLHPFAFGESGGHDFVGVFDVAARGNCNRLRHLHHDVRLRNVPAFRPVRRRGRIACVASGRAAFRPAYKSRDFLRRERRIVREMSATRIGEPRRHFPVAHCGGNCLRFGTRVVKRDERERRDFAGAMAALAMLLQDRQHVAVESWRRICRVRDRSRAEGAGALCCCTKQQRAAS